MVVVGRECPPASPRRAAQLRQGAGRCAASVRGFGSSSEDRGRLSRHGDISSCAFGAGRSRVSVRALPGSKPDAIELSREIASALWVYAHARAPRETSVEGHRGPGERRARNRAGDAGVWLETHARGRRATRRGQAQRERGKALGQWAKRGAGGRDAGEMGEARGRWAKRWEDGRSAGRSRRARGRWAKRGGDGRSAGEMGEALGRWAKRGGIAPSAGEMGEARGRWAKRGGDGRSAGKMYPLHGPPRCPDLAACPDRGA